MNERDEIINFSCQVETLAKAKGIPYMEALIMYCEERELEIEVAAKLVSASLKAKIRIEAEDLHYLPKTSRARLPI